MNLASHALNLNRFREINENIPLACGYLKAYAMASGLGEEVDIRILSPQLADLGGDLRLISYIVEGEYDLVGFSLYQWNALRSLHIAREVRKRDLRVKFLAGGPEVSAVTEYLMEEKTLDFMIEGEGEESFRRLLQSLCEGRHSAGEIPGLFHREGTRLVNNSPPEALKDLSSLPSPYLQGIIDPADHHHMHLETMRGCIYSCRYCSWRRCGRRGASFFPVERIRQDILLARERGTRSIRIADSGINISKKHLKNLCEMISQVNHDRALELLGFLHPELVDEESARWLSEIGIKYLIIGLQSTNPAALKAIGREADLDAYLRGTSLLDKYGINFVSCIILGLPGDTVEGFMETMEFLLQHNYLKVICFPLSVSPNTPLRYEAEELGIRYQKLPPNLVISTPTMDFSSLRECVRLFRQKFSLASGEAYFEKDIHDIGRDFFPLEHHFHWKSVPSLITYARGTYPRTAGKESPAKPLEKLLPLASGQPITRIILSRTSRSDAEKMASLLAPVISWNTLLWLKNFGADEDIPFLRKLMHSLSELNLFHIWHVVLDFEREVALESLSAIASSVRSMPGLLDYESLYEQERFSAEYVTLGPLIYAVVPYGDPGITPQWAARLSERLPMFWSLTLPAVMEETPSPGAGWLIDFSPENLPSQILYTLNMIRNFPDRRPRFFKNWVIQRLWSLYCLGQVSPWGAGDNVLEITASGKGTFVHFSLGYLKKQIGDWMRSRSRGD